MTIKLIGFLFAFCASAVAHANCVRRAPLDGVSLNVNGDFNVTQMGETFKLCNVKAVSGTVSPEICTLWYNQLLQARVADSRVEILVVTDADVAYGTCYISVEMMLQRPGAEIQSVGIIPYN